MTEAVLEPRGVSAEFDYQGEEEVDNPPCWVERFTVVLFSISLYSL